MNLLRPEPDDTVFTEHGVEWCVIYTDPRRNTCGLLRQTRTGHFNTRYNVPWWELKRTHGNQFNDQGDYAND
jgi:hypothetical protein